MLVLRLARSGLLFGLFCGIISQLRHQTEKPHCVALREPHFFKSLNKCVRVTQTVLLNWNRHGEREQLFSVYFPLLKTGDTVSEIPSATKKIGKGINCAKRRPLSQPLRNFPFSPLGCISREPHGWFSRPQRLRGENRHFRQQSPRFLQIGNGEVLENGVGTRCRLFTRIFREIERGKFWFMSWRLQNK